MKEETRFFGRIAFVMKLSETLTPEMVVALSRLLANEAEAVRDHVVAGTYEFEEAKVTLVVDGTMQVAASQERVGTCKIPYTTVIALLLRRMGVQREAALDLLGSVLSEAETVDPNTEILQETGVAECLKMFRQRVIQNMPRISANGAIRVAGRVRLVVN